MKLTLKENVNTKSMVLKHSIMLEVTNLTVGREGALQTEKESYLILSMIDNLIEENLIELCNEDGRDLIEILEVEVEPLFFSLMEKEEYSALYKEVRELYLQHCKEVWNNEHSIVGVIDSVLTMIASMEPEDKKEALVATGKIAEQAFERRTATMEKKTEETNAKLEELIKQYQKKEGQPEVQEENKEEVKEDNAE